MEKRRVRRSAEDTRQLMIAEGVRQLQERGVGLGVDHLTLESAFVRLDIPRSSSHAAWSTDEAFTPQETYQRAVLREWLLHRESTIFADSAREALLELFADNDGKPSAGSVIRTAIQAAFAAGIGLSEDVVRGDGDFLTTDLALRFALVSQASAERDSDVSEWVRSSELANREARILDSYRPLADLLGYRPRPEFGDAAFTFFAIAVASLVEGIGLRHRILPELELGKPVLDAPDREAPMELIGVCVEALVPVFFEKVPASESEEL